ncbi:Vps5-domain-containing protein [Exidia glandulosa HHB12029]|uniref:Vps5-domain-containing protein n=1 Tax=Exidia glandulosa HHB12029 TaxID=1314781 RepID=A0A165N0E7_EXIGL|nr:Vps5-domain-containing protein [Exidia glandulosa HHB12029]
MSGFDDLVHNDDNPFASPFATARPASPDPWAVYPETADYAAAREADVYPAFDDPHRPDDDDDEPIAKPAASGPVPVAADAGPLPIPEDEPEPEPAPVRRRPTVTKPASPPPPPSPAERPATPPPPTPPVEQEPEPTQPASAPASSPSHSRTASSHRASPIVSPTTSSIPTPVAVPASLHSPLDPVPSSARSYSPGLTLGAEVPGFAWGASTSQSRFINEPQPSSPPAVPQEEPEQSFEASDDDKKKEEQPTFIVSVGDPQKVGDAISAHIIYTVHTRTTSKLYRKSEFSVLRRYSDFLWLYETLSLNNPGVIVPPVPEKAPFGRFQDTFVENRRVALNRCIQKMANHPLLKDDPDLKLFLESDNFALEVKHRKDDRAGLLASIGQTLTGNRFFETDEWLENRKAYLEGLEQTLRTLAKAIDFVSKERSVVAATILEFAEAISALAASDLSAHLSNLLTMLGDVSRTSADLQTAQARDDALTLMGTANEYARLINSVRMAFASRVRSFNQWQKADAEARRVKLAHEQARRQGRIAPDRSAFALAEIAEAEKRANDTKREFEEVSKLLRTELIRFEQERIEDFKESLEEFLEGMIAKQKKLIRAWETYQEALLQRHGQNPTQRGAIVEAS